ncbi:exocyst complex component SEC10A-like protein [Tanacetum coccineum]
MVRIFLGTGLTEALFLEHKDYYPANLAANAKAVFACLLDQVSEGIGRSREGLKEAASHRERFSLGRKVGAAAASAAEAAAATGEIHFRSFMVALQACGSSVAIIQQYFAKSISRLLLPVDGAHTATCEEIAAAMSSAESSACQGLHRCIEIVISEVERLLTAEQKATDYRSVDDSLMADHRPTTVCTSKMVLKHLGSNVIYNYQPHSCLLSRETPLDIDMIQHHFNFDVTLPSDSVNESVL